MGLSASQSRFLALTARKSDIEFQGQQVNQQRTVLASGTRELANRLASYLNTVDPSVTDVEADPIYQGFINEQSIIHADDQVLEMALKDIDTQHNAVQTEIDAVKKVIDKNIDATFKTFA
jgi:hypothetical protein